MPALPLQCPLCAGVLQIDTAWAGQQVACPLCQGVIAVPPAAALGGMLASSSDRTDLLPPGAPPSLPAFPTNEPTAVATSIPAVDVGIAAQDRRRPSRAEKSQRRLRKNLILFGICIVVLVIVFYFLAT